jgi:GTPase
VASFKSTLAEALEASLLAHVVDASDPGFERQLEVTAGVLAEIGAGEVPRLLVFNKIDRLGDEAARGAAVAGLLARWPDAVVMSAKDPADVARLHARLAAYFTRDLVEAELRVPWDRQQLRGEIFAACEVVDERAEAEAAVFRVRARRETIARLGGS